MNYPFARKILYPLLAFAVLLLVWLPFLYKVFIELVDGPTGPVIDDAFMFVRYAKMMLAGYGASWNMDEGPVYGNTSQLHFLFVVFLQAFTSLSNERIVVFASTIPSLLLLFYFPWVCAKHSPAFSDKSRLWRYFFWCVTAGAAFIFFSRIDFHFRMGMETGLSTLMHLCLIDAVLTFGKNPLLRNKILVVVFAWAIFATRIDNIIVAFLFPAAYLFFVANRRRDAWHVFLSLGVLVLITELFFDWYFGDFLPLSFYSKHSGYLHGYASTVGYHVLFSISEFLYGIWPFLCAAIFFYKRKNLLSLCVFFIPPVLTISYYFTMITLMNAESRYCFPFTMYFAIAGCLYVSKENFEKKYATNLLALLLSVFLYVGIYVLDKYRWEITGYIAPSEAPCEVGTLLNLDPGVPDLTPYRGFFSLRMMSKMLHDLPAGLTVVMTEHGYVGAENPHIHIIDAVGLHNRYIAHHGFSAEWLFREIKPDAIWIPHQDYTCINHDILFSQDFREGYEYYPGLFNWGYAIRKDSPHYPEMRHQLEIMWQALYPGFVMEKYQKHYY